MEQKLKRKLTDEKSSKRAKEITNLSSVTEVDLLYHVVANIITNVLLINLILDHVISHDINIIVKVQWMNTGSKQ